MNRIAKMSNRLRWVFWVGMWLVPVVNAVGWAVLDPARSAPPMGIELGLGLGGPVSVPVIGQLSPLARILGFATSMLPGAAAMFGLLCLARLCALLGRGELFTGGTVRLIRRAGMAVVAQQGLRVLYGALASLVLTMGNPPGSHYISLGLDSAFVTGTVMGAVAILASWIVDEARRLREEQELVI